MQTEYTIDPTASEELSNRKLLEKKLKEHFFIVGAGAWQHLWEMKDEPKSMGFSSQSDASNQSEPQAVKPDYKKLKSSIRPELLRRFSDDVLIMTPLTKGDYKVLTNEFASKMEPSLQKHFITLAKAGIDKALKTQLGMRFFEVIYTKAMLLNRKSQKSEIQQS